MPYIKQELRDRLDMFIDSFPVLSTGELNYVVTRLLLNTNPTRYEDYNSLIGVLECTKQEFYRRAVATYEDVKATENGDLYCLEKKEGLPLQ